MYVFITDIVCPTQEYADYIPRYFSISENERTEEEKVILRQILVDVRPRVTFSLI